MEEFDAARLTCDLKELRTVLREITIDAPRRKLWEKDFDEIDKSRHPQFLVGVTGSTGCGKSSLINSLLEKEVLPVSSESACTATVCEVAYHDSTSPKAEVEFLTTNEWRDELQLCYPDLLEESDRDDEACAAAWARFLTVYPNLRTQIRNTAVTDLVQNFRGHEYLGTTLILETEGNSENFAEKLSKFTCAVENDFGYQLWPLVKRVRIRLDAPFLSEGMVLVDLPGGDDTNAARDSLARSYLSRCDAIWIAADVTRATDNAVSGQYVQLYADGRLTDGFVTLIATKSDQSVSEEQPWEKEDTDLVGLKTEMEQLSGDIRNMDVQLHKLRPRSNIEETRTSSLQGRSKPYKLRGSRQSPCHTLLKPRPAEPFDKLPYLSPLTSPDSLQIQQQLESLKARRDMLWERISKIKIDHRNSSVAERWQRKVQEAIGRASDGECPITVEVFCVSAKEHVALRKDVNRITLTFDDISETGIYDLQDHALVQTQNMRNLALRHYMTHIRALRDSMESYFDFVTVERKLELHAQVMSEIALLRSRLQKLVKRHCTELGTALCTLELSIRDGCKEAVRDAEGVHDMMAVIVRWNSYRAIMRRNGEWRENNFNAAVIRPVVRTLGAAWNARRQTESRKIIGTLSDHIISEVRNTAESIANAARQATNANVDKLVDAAKDDSFINIICDQAVGKLERGRRDMVHGLSSKMKTLLVDQYGRVGMESGQGTFHRMKTAMREYINQHKERLFEEFIEKALPGFDALRAQLEADLDKKIEEVVEKVGVSLSPLYADVLLPQNEQSSRERAMNIWRNVTNALDIYDAYVTAAEAMDVDDGDQGLQVQSNATEDDDDLYT